MLPNFDNISLYVPSNPGLLDQSRTGLDSSSSQRLLSCFFSPLFLLGTEGISCLLLLRGVRPTFVAFENICFRETTKPRRQVWP